MTFKERKSEELFGLNEEELKAQMGLTNEDVGRITGGEPESNDEGLGRFEEEREVIDEGLDNFYLQFLLSVFDLEQGAILERNNGDVSLKDLQELSDAFMVFSDYVQNVRSKESKLASLLSHDCGNLLNRVTLILGLLTNEDFSFCLKNSLSTYVNDFLALKSTIRSVNYWYDPKESRREVKCVDFGVYIQNLEDLLKSFFDGNVYFEGNVNGLMVMLNEDMMTNIFINLVVNAEKRGMADNIVFGFKENGTYLIVDVDDDGQGFSRDIESKIFDDGYSGKEGTGIGLASLPQRMGLMGGNVDCEGKGSKFGGAKFVLSLKKGN